MIERESSHPPNFCSRLAQKVKIQLLKHLTTVDGVAEPLDKFQHK